MMKRVVLISVALIVVAYFVNSFLENKKKEAGEKAQAERIEKATRAALAQLVERTNAFANWDKILSKGEPLRMEPILTIELERLWLTGRPILFGGAIKDIAKIDEDNYRVEVEKSMFNGFEHRFETELLLSLKCQKQKIDLFLAENSNLFKDYGLNNGIAVIASIDEIETKLVPGAEIGSEIKVGKGKCIDIIYTGTMEFQ